MEFVVHIEGAEEFYHGDSSYKIENGVLTVVKADEDGTKRRIVYGPAAWLRVAESEPLRPRAEPRAGRVG